jgi:alpha-beta hydrolase superfamily lysophospholipase
MRGEEVADQGGPADERQWTIVGERDRSLAARRWGPLGRPALVLSHGLGEHSGRYLHVAQAAGAAGWAVYALDHRGHGRSEGPRANIERVEWAVSDLDQLVSVATRESGKSPVLFGHSMGGGLALAYALSRQERLQALAVSAPAIDLARRPAWQLAAVRALAAVAPNLGMATIDPATVSRDGQVVEAYASDPLVWHGKVPANAAVQMARAGTMAYARAAEITLPTLVLQGGADRLVDPDAIRRLHETLGAQDKRLCVYDGLYHEVLNEPERAEVVADLLAWMEAHRP